jgi:SRSO17 transposase
MPQGHFAGGEVWLNQEVLVREEQRRHLAVYVEGRLLPLQRRTGEPIATHRGVKARPLQHFVGQGKWADEAVCEVMADLIAEKMGSRWGALILDVSGIQWVTPWGVPV